MPPVLLWLRNDLRLHDHEAWHMALATGAPVLPVYCVDPGQFALDATLGVPRSGPFRAQFLLEALHDLRESCRARGGELLIRMGSPAHELPRLAQAVQAAGVVLHEEPATDERAEVRAVRDALARDGRWCRTVAGHSLVPEDALPFAEGSVPGTFTAFRRLVEREVTIPEARPAPRALPAVVLPPDCAPGAVPSLTDLGLDAPPQDSRAQWRCTGGERAGLDRLDAWMWRADRLRRYKQTRNGLLDPDDASRLSPWLALGCLSVRHVHDEVRRYEAARVRSDDTNWLVVELLWRDFFRFSARAAGTRLFAAGGIQRHRMRWRTLDAPDAQHDFERWATGTTGFPLVDAAMRELAATGFTTNRARQNAASFLSRVLGLDWRLGAAWFEAWLVDYDVSSNWGNWQYVAGVGHDARGFRFFNVHKQALDYDPDARYLRHWLPELAALSAADAHRPERSGRAVGYPAPMCDLTEAARATERRYLAGGGN